MGGVAEQRSDERNRQRTEVLEEWAAENGISLERLDIGQQWVVFAALQIVTFLGAISALKRVLGYLLAHSNMDLGGKVISAIVGISDRSLRSAKSLDPIEMLHSVRHPIGGHRRPKLRAEHAGVVAKYLVENPKAQVSDVLEFIRIEFAVTMDRLTLRRFVKRYGLGCLRGEEIRERAPFLAGRSSEAPFS